MFRLSAFFDEPDLSRSPATSSASRPKPRADNPACLRETEAPLRRRQVGGREDGSPSKYDVDGFLFTYMHSITRLIYTGVLDRFPSLEFAFFEGGAGWVPFLRNQLDQETKHRSFRQYCENNDLRLERKPSEYFDRLYVAAISYEPYLADTARRWGDHRRLV